MRGGDLVEVPIVEVLPVVLNVVLPRGRPLYAHRVVVPLSVRVILEPLLRRDGPELAAYHRSVHTESDSQRKAVSLSDELCMCDCDCNCKL